MQKTEEQKEAVTEKKSRFEFFIEIISWLQIVASPFLAASIIGAIIYFSKPNRTTLVIAIVTVTIGLIIGIIWATKVWRKKGTIHFMSRIMATSELDNKDEDQK